MFTEMTIKNAIFWNVKRVALLTTDVSEERMVSILRSALRLLVTANVVPRSPILFTLMMEALRSPETSVLNESHAASHSRRRHSSI
jgi:hypothetical protein